MAATALSSESFVLKAGALLPGTAYAFNLRAADIGGESTAEVAFTTAPSPGSNLGNAGGLGAAAPFRSQQDGTPAGVAFATVFTISARGWVPQGDGPFLYQVSFVDSSGAPVTLFAFQVRLGGNGCCRPARSGKPSSLSPA